MNKVIIPRSIGILYSLGNHLTNKHDGKGSSELDFSHWGGHRYFPISQFYKQRFGEKVYKVSVSIAETCPNRQPNTRMPLCIFCDEWGSAAYHLERDKPLQEQIIINREKIAKRYRAKKFLVYFQSYTNTFDRVSELEQRFEVALSEENIAGIVLGTRPDCLPARILPLLQKTHESHYVMVELGLQSFFDHHLTFLQRGHDVQRGYDAIAKLHEHTGVDIGIHLIFGLPDETDEEIIQTAQILNNLPISNVKLHNLHVLSKTPLAEQYERGEFQPIELDEYINKVTLFLQHLSPDIAVQRLAAVASRWDEFIAPQWTKEKMRPTQAIEDQLKIQSIYQGKLS
ncbi:TIGR01212 family radical SAM protein [sulfur-oxidizing endosymbiont of Gigantopelta aegis]|uniref:TIGR01212 family radical SAM protein n=1 Tax=sulfur-oxidizing endosymbiont of Gigantopelta aegis TaxID=2794934 RepID=UPI001FEBE949|nr:TIGR01212 family radical SAM protein [sulfur-oxidizing endosymbiont of Gigantopelta aegis]